MFSDIRLETCISKRKLSLSYLHFLAEKNVYENNKPTEKDINRAAGLCGTGNSFS